jgi:hypothetical protein
VYTLRKDLSMIKLSIGLIAAGCLVLAAINLSSRAKPHAVEAHNEIVAKPVNTVHVRCIADCDSYNYVTEKFYVKATTKPVPYAHLDWSRSFDSRYDLKMSNMESIAGRCGIGGVDLGR